MRGRLLARMSNTLNADFFQNQERAAAPLIP
jgi:hypothetical protein